MLTQHIEDNRDSWKGGGNQQTTEAYGVYMNFVTLTQILLRGGATPHRITATDQPTTDRIIYVLARFLLWLTSALAMIASSGHKIWQGIVYVMLASMAKKTIIFCGLFSFLFFFS